MENVILQSGLRLINKYNSIAKKPRYYETDTLLYPSEIHVIDAIGAEGNNTTTRLAERLGITKGGVSQIVSKLFEKDMIIKTAGDGINEVQLSLSEKGRKAYEGHIKLHQSMNKRLNTMITKMDAKTKDEIKSILDVLDEELSRMEATE
ncbi:MAG: winged helix-turn-helix transcriptional regulator [Lachnospiraceae bacterium]|nr:winged helix-turn-helix transcriptional regulator [Lachnospiraceae bacterium]